MSWRRWSGNCDTVLEVSDLEVEIQNSEILRGISFSVAAGEIVCLVGRNGAGKTTTLRTIMGYIAPRRGMVRLAGADLAGKSTLERARLGIGYSPEDSEVLGELTVAENVALPTWTRRTNKPAAERIDTAFEVFPNLRRYAGRPGTHLSGGERKMLSIARALALDAKILLLDEPFEGLSPTIIPGIRSSVHKIVQFGPAVLIAESELQHVPDYASRIYVLERGEIVFSGNLSDARSDPAVRRIIGATI
jgi:branched-chain amino acid transport system ATP-binding protein